MKILSEEKVKVLAERNSWSLAYAEGYLEGESVRRRGVAPSKHAQIGIDEYSLGFRAGFYDRDNENLRRSDRPDTRVRALRTIGRS